MFEGHAIHVAFEDAADEPALRRLHWSDLVARLEAARDLRMVLGGTSPAISASFGRGAAGYFAAAGEGKPGVNQEGLGHCKSADGRDISTPHPATDGDREI